MGPETPLSWKEAGDALSDAQSVLGTGTSKDKILELALTKAFTNRFWSDMEKQFIKRYVAERIDPTRASICIEQAQIDLCLFDTDTSSIDKEAVLEQAYSFYIRDTPEISKPANVSIVNGRLNRNKFDIPVILKEANVSLHTWKLICDKMEVDYCPFYSRAKTL